MATTDAEGKASVAALAAGKAWVLLRCRGTCRGCWRPRSRPPGSTSGRRSCSRGSRSRAGSSTRPARGGGRHDPGGRWPGGRPGRAQRFRGPLHDSRPAPGGRARPPGEAQGLHHGGAREGEPAARGRGGAAHAQGAGAHRQGGGRRDPGSGQGRHGDRHEDRRARVRGGAGISTPPRAAPTGGPTTAASSVWRGWSRRSTTSGSGPRGTRPSPSRCGCRPRVSCSPSPSPSRRASRCVVGSWTPPGNRFPAPRSTPRRRPRSTSEPACARGNSGGARSGPDGTFVIQGLAAGKHEVRARAEDGASGRVVAEAGAQDVLLRLERPGTVQGRVRAPEGARCRGPEGADLYGREEAVLTGDATTDGGGAFVLEQVPPGTYHGWWRRARSPRAARR